MIATSKLEVDDRKEGGKSQNLKSGFKQKKVGRSRASICVYDSLIIRKKIFCSDDILRGCALMHV